MSVQIIKWIILLFVTGNCLSETCKANDAPKVCLPVQSNITIINQADNMLDSLVSFLHFNAGDLTEETTHKTLDKKVFIRLFIQSRHNKIQSPAEDPLNKFIPASSFHRAGSHRLLHLYATKNYYLNRRFVQIKKYRLETDADSSVF